ncbi:MAG: H-NS histone family protein [Pseudomonadota bacterium]
MAKINFEKMSVNELEQLKASAEQTLVEKRKADRKLALNAAKEAAAKYGFTLTELFGDAKKTEKPKSATPPKYAHPENASITWTGRGRQPGWIKDAVAAGKSLDEFLIAK